LGLSISKKLAELMGSEIQMSSRKGKGTGVWFEIEYVIGNADMLVLNNNIHNHPEILKGKKILVVEDNSMNRMLACITVENYGASFIQAANGLEAVQKMEAEKFDLVLMDIQMPQLDGYQASMQIRNHLKLNTPIIALTANAIKGEMEKCLEYGMNDYLSKPFEEEDLINKIVKLLDIKIEKSKKKKKAVKAVPESLYSLSKLEMVSRGNREFVEKMVNLFIEQNIENISQINTALDNCDFEKIKSIAHKMIPAIDNLSITSLQQEIRIIEKLGAEKNMNELASKIDLLTQKIEEVILHLKENVLFSQESKKWKKIPQNG
jgi:CheY-like chemotaxis protein